MFFCQSLIFKLIATDDLFFNAVRLIFKSLCAHVGNKCVLLTVNQV